MSQGLLKDNIRFVEPVDKLVDPSGNVPELIEEIVSNIDALPRRQSAWQDRIAAHGEIPDGGGDPAGLARTVGAQDELAFVPAIRAELG